MDNWNPTSDKEKELKEALIRLKKSTEGVILTPVDQKREEAKEKRFILQGRSYFALKSYVKTGKEFPKTEAEFDQQIPKECFTALDTVDPEIHAQTKAGLVGMGSSCSKFYDESLYRIIDAGTLAVTWSETTLNLLKHTTDFNLYDQLMVLVDTKYQRPSDRDQAWINAYNAATFSLNKLAQEADDGKTEAEAIRNILLKFRDSTNDLFPLVQTLVAKYEKGPVTNPKSQNKPYLTYLNEDLAKATKEMNDTLTRYNDVYNAWKDDNGVAVGVALTCVLLPLFGWFPLTIAEKRSSLLQEAWGKLWASYNTLAKHNADEAKLVKFVQSMIKQWEGILEKMDGAIAAVGVLSQMFQEQSECYKLIKKALSNTNESTTQEDAFIRKLFIQGSMKETIQKVTELQKAGAGFINAIINDTPEPIFDVPKPAV